MQICPCSLLVKDICRVNRNRFMCECFSLKRNFTSSLTGLVFARNITVSFFHYSSRQNKIRKPHSHRDKVNFGLVERLYKKHFDGKHVLPITNSRITFDGKIPYDSNSADFITKIRCLTLEQRTPHFMKEMEKEFIMQMTSVDFSQLLTVLECFVLQKYKAYKLYRNMITYSNLTYENINFSKSNLVRFMFQIFIFGEAPDELCDKLEQSIFQFVEELRVSEISVICLGFFRCNRQIKSYDLQNIFSQKVIENVETITMEDLSNVLKVFRHSNFKKLSFYEELGDKIISVFKNKDWKINLHTLMHISFMYASTKFYHRQLMEIILNESLQLLKESTSELTQSYRSKDVALLIWALGTFRISVSCDEYKVFVDSFEKIIQETDIKKYSQSIVDFNLGSIYLGFFPEKSLKIMFSPDQLQIYKGGKHNTDERIFQILLSHNSIRMECKAFPHKTLSQEYLSSILGHPNAYGYLNKELKYRVGLQTLYTDLRELLGDEKVHCHFILPHFKSADIEIHSDENGTPVRFDPKPGIMYQGYDCEELEICDDEEMKDEMHAGEIRKTVISVVGKNQCAVNCDLILGHHETKLRQLRKLGYNVIVIMPSSAEEYFYKESVERKEYIQKEILSRLKKNQIRL